MGWGKVLGFISDWLPGRKERYRSQIDKIKEEMDELANKDKMSNRDSVRYKYLADKLQKYEKALTNIR